MSVLPLDCFWDSSVCVKVDWLTDWHFSCELALPAFGKEKDAHKKDESQITLLTQTIIWNLSLTKWFLNVFSKLCRHIRVQISEHWSTFVNKWLCYVKNTQCGCVSNSDFVLKMFIALLQDVCRIFLLDFQPAVISFVVWCIILFRYTLFVKS